MIVGTNILNNYIKLCSKTVYKKLGASICTPSFALYTLIQNSYFLISVYTFIFFSFPKILFN